MVSAYINKEKKKYAFAVLRHNLGKNNFRFCLKMPI
jgi:hypothetical protein